MLKNTSVSIENTNACIKPTKISSIRNGMGARNGARAPIIMRSTSPANTFPKSRNEKETTFANSPRFYPERLLAIRVAAGEERPTVPGRR